MNEYTKLLRCLHTSSGVTVQMYGIPVSLVEDGRVPVHGDGCSELSWMNHCCFYLYVVYLAINTISALNSRP